MAKNQNSKPTKPWKLPPGWIQFLVILPPDLAKLFAEEMVALDRKKLPLARLIIKQYFNDRKLRQEIDEFKQYQKEKKILRVGDDESESSDEAARRNAAR
jgi:hypothetical protein